MFRKTKSKLAVLLSVILCVSMMIGMGSVFAAETEHVSMESAVAESGDITPYEFTRHYTTALSGGVHSVMSDSNAYDDDDMIRITLTGNTTTGDITYMVREYSPFGGSEQEATVSLHGECEFQIQSGNNFSVFASSTDGSSGKINTTVSLSAQ